MSRPEREGWSVRVVLAHLADAGLVRADDSKDWRGFQKIRYTTSPPTATGTAAAADWP
jgi:hypothetical protein